MASSGSTKRVDIDEDVDDLDDLIGQFTPQVPKTPKNTANQTPSPIPSANPAAHSKLQTPAAASSDSKSPAASDAFSDEFAKEFAKGMESLLKEIGGEGALPTEGGTSEEDLEKDKVFKAAWESLFLEGIGGAEASKPPSASAPTQPEAGEESFQSRIKKTMEKMKESESTLKADSGSSNSELESLLSELGKMGEGGEGDEDLQGILETMMSQLMSKEVLYEPLKELHDKFPVYLMENAKTLSTEDKKRYESQQECVKKIITIFEAPKYSEEDPEQGFKVVTLMNEMQSFGAPPTEIMGDLPPGMNLGSDGLPQMPEGCTLM